MGFSGLGFGIFVRVCMWVYLFLDKPPRQPDFKTKQRCCMQGFGLLALVASPLRLCSVCRGIIGIIQGLGILLL